MGPVDEKLDLVDYELILITDLYIVATFFLLIINIHSLNFVMR